VHGEKLSIRIGIATGLVVVGAPIGEGDARQQTAIGETPNLAARLQGLATPNNLVIADSTRIQVGSLFDLEDLGARPLAGFAEPKRAWRVIDESGAPGRCEALRSDTMPLIGRGEELELLLRRWHQAKAGDGRVALISGEPGIGKSRLTAAVSDEIHGQPHRRLRWFCSPHHRDSALYPTIAQLERAAGFARDDSPEAKLAKARDRGLALLASLFQALFGSWINNSGLGGIRAARPFMHRVAQVADLADDDALRHQAHHSGWSTLWSPGEPMAAHAHTEEGRRLYDPEQHRSHRHIYGGHDPGVCARMTGGMTEWLLGYPAKARTSIVDAMDLAAQIAHPFSREYAFEYSAVVHLHRGEPELALPLLVAADALRTEQRISSVFEHRAGTPDGRVRHRLYGPCGDGEEALEPREHAYAYLAG
jgi:AAA ATPase domain/Adenylate and Guanylate cyclase catalytic domain